MGEAETVPGYEPSDESESDFNDTGASYGMQSDYHEDSYGQGGMPYSAYGGASPPPQNNDMMKSITEKVVKQSKLVKAMGQKLSEILEIMDEKEEEAANKKPEESALVLGLSHTNWTLLVIGMLVGTFASIGMITY